MGASALELVSLLYDGAQEAVRSALRHLAEGDIAARSREITRAQMILAELASSVDQERGGDISRQLLDLYAYLQRRLTTANTEQKPEPLEEVGRLLGTLIDGWRQCRTALEAIDAPPIRSGHYEAEPVAAY